MLIYIEITFEDEQESRTSKLWYKENTPVSIHYVFHQLYSFYLRYVDVRDMIASELVRVSTCGLEIDADICGIPKICLFSHAACSLRKGKKEGGKKKDKDKLL